MAEIKTKKTDASVADYVASVKDPVQQKDSKELIKIMKDITKEQPKMWGSSLHPFAYHQSERKVTGLL